MAYRWHPKNAQVDADNPRAWGTCDRCGFVWNLDKLNWQYAYQGSMTPQNTRFLVCSRCNDPLNPQDAPLILPPDPLPVFNARPENYVLDESSWLSTQDGDVITTQDGEPITTAIPSPSQAANTSKLVSYIAASGGSVATAYLDLFDGDPTSGGTSVLAAITGSAVRTDIAATLTTVSGVARNPDYIVISAASENQTNISYVGIYSAASGGTLLMSGSLSASPTIAQDNPVQFNPLGLTINLN
jgi:hypothetical protein